MPQGIGSAIAHVRTFFVEEPKSARRLLKQLHPDFPLQECRFFDLNEHTSSAKLKDYVDILKGSDAGIVSESGCPCVADPGADLVWLAHQDNVEVVPLVGSSSILLALMASGLNGQNFAFNGYLSKDKQQRAAKMKMLQRRSQQEDQTQIFMETPYRNQSLFDELLEGLSLQTRLCVACDITGQGQFIRTKTIETWRKANIQLPKSPCLFIIK